MTAHERQGEFVKDIRRTSDGGIVVTLALPLTEAMGRRGLSGRLHGRPRGAARQDDRAAGDRAAGAAPLFAEQAEAFADRVSIRAKVIQAAGAGHAASATLRQALDHGPETVRGGRTSRHRAPPSARQCHC